MKTYKHLWDTLISDENIEESIKDAAIGKLDRAEVKIWLKHPEILHDYIVNNVEYWCNRKHTPIIIHDRGSSKEREIICPTYDENVLHHMIINSLHPMLTKGMYAHTYASIQKRGIHKCIKTIRNWIDHNHKECKYFVKLDIRKFFNNIDHDLLMYRFSTYIDDDKMLNLLRTIVNAVPKGLPLGFYTSHWFANWFLQPLDHFIKEKLHIKFYARYMDDMILFNSNKRKLKYACVEIENFLNCIGLELKNKPDIRRFVHNKKGEIVGYPVDFVGFKLYRDRTRLRKRLMLKLTRKAKKIKKKGKFTIHDAHQIMSYLGWVSWSDTYNVYKKYVSNVITFKQIKKYISKYDKKVNKTKKK